MRQEIQTFRKAGPAWDLYVLALQRFQQQEQSSQFSYYQVAGIHGRPFVAWDGADGNGNAGYCPHGSVLFGPWHRAYLAAYEQVLWGYAQEIAKTYPAGAERQRYVNAATTLRIPYWDWARYTKLPEVTTSPKLEINTPAGKKSVINPLYTYRFLSLSDFPTNVQASFPLLPNHTPTGVLSKLSFSLSFGHC